MDSSEEQQWASSEQFDLLPGVGSGADFTDFLDLDLNHEFPIFSGDQAAQENDEGVHAQNLQDVLDPQLASHSNHAHISLVQHGVHDHSSPEFALGEGHSRHVFVLPSSGQYELAQQRHVQRLGDQRAAFTNHEEPATPNSSKMHSDPQAYLRHMDAQTRAVLEQQYQLRKHEMMSFTPLVSPAVTPHDTRFQLPQDFTTVPGAYFSPLTSPALNGHPHPLIGSQTPRFHPSAPQSTSSNTASPIDIDMEMLGDPVVQQPAAPPTRKSTRKRPGTSGSASARLRQSPVVKPQSKHKTTISAQFVSKEVSSFLDQEQRSQINSPLQQGFPAEHANASSNATSCSPEPLAEALMGPPPKPGSAMQSPAILAQNELSTSGVRGAIPATPASLMRIDNSKTTPSHNGGIDGHESPSMNKGLNRNGSSLEDLTLPESAVGGATYNRSSSTGSRTPRALPQLTTLSPVTMTPMASPVSTNVTSNGKRGSTSDAKSGRGKKRNSTSISEGRSAVTGGGSGSAPLISPALRPKIISPSIKPMTSTSTPTSASQTPTGATPMAISEHTAHLLLASKSNYQHLVDGTNVNVPGLEYPESLSTGLTSKRTSHKIAEQGRRNRINVALVEMGRLLPPELKGTKSPTIAAQDKKSSSTPSSVSPSAKKTNGQSEDGNGGSANAGNSKAATVESAILYIKLLQQQAEERDRQIREREDEIAGLRMKLLGTGVANSDQGDAEPDATESSPKVRSGAEDDVTGPQGAEADIQPETSDADKKMEDG